MKSMYSLVLGLTLSCLHAIVSGCENSPLDLSRRNNGSSGPPYFVAYYDGGNTDRPPPVSQLVGFNVFILSFYTIEGPADQAANWQKLSPADRKAIILAYQAAGILIMVSAFGSTDKPTTNNADPNQTADKLAGWVKQYDLDGVDVDYEDFDAFNRKNGDAVNWVVTFTRRLKEKLPEGSIITHAPIAPWFVDSEYDGHGYSEIDKKVGNLTDWYNVQFYNQGSHEYTTCTGLLNNSAGSEPGSALFQISERGVPLDKLVVGKIVVSSEGNGIMDVSLLATCIGEAHNRGWNAGIMVWQFSDAGVGASWIEKARSLAFPLLGRRWNFWGEY